MQTWKINIINRLSEKAKACKEFELYETAIELGYEDILVSEIDEITNEFLAQNQTYKVIKGNFTGNELKSTGKYLFQRVVFKEMELDELDKRNNLAKIRNKKGYSQAKLAELSGLNIRMIQKYESGERDFKKALVQTAIKIADALQVTLDELFIR